MTAAMVLPEAGRSTKKGILEDTGEMLSPVTPEEVHNGRAGLPKKAGE